MLVIGCWKKCITAAPETVSSSACNSGVQGTHTGRTQEHCTPVRMWGQLMQGQEHSHIWGPALLIAQVPGQQLLCHALVLCSIVCMQGVPGLALSSLPAAAPFSITAASISCTVDATRRNVTWAHAAAAVVEPLALAVRAELDRATSATLLASLST